VLYIVVHLGNPPELDCRFTTYGCCPGDNFTPARGPNGAGCPGKPHSKLNPNTHFNGFGCSDKHSSFNTFFCFTSP